MRNDPRSALEGALGVLATARDVVANRVDEPEVPDWCTRRGWSDFLLGLSDANLARCESLGLAEIAIELPGVPPSLVAFAQQVRVAVEVAPMPVESVAGEHRLRSVSPRKRDQIHAVLSACRAMSQNAVRIVDVGAGRGQLTHEAARRLGARALGLERDPRRVRTAMTLGDAATFRALDLVLVPRELCLAPDDLVLGLHACGELGDVMIEATARAGCGLLLVSCCLQKIDGPVRRPLSSIAGAAGFSLDRAVLGLTNLTVRERGVEVTTAETMRAREARYALRLLLRGRDVDVPPGEEMRGINRRVARHGLAALAERALPIRGLGPPSADEIERCASEASRAFAVVRRLSLPRNMLARLLEVAVVLDRASLLAERGQRVDVVRIVPDTVTPRNLAIVARPLTSGP